MWKNLSQGKKNLSQVKKNLSQSTVHIYQNKYCFLGCGAV
jgi:hypothetical protein